MIPDAILHWYAARAPREQRILRWGAVVAPILLLFVIMLPLHRAATALEQRVATKQKDLAWMRAVVPTLAAAGPVKADESEQTVVEIVDHAINESGLSNVVTGALPAGEGRLKVQFEKAPFNGLLAWSKWLADQRGIRIDAATIEAAGEPGTVNATFTVLELP